jgi:hypothetical protein
MSLSAVEVEQLPYKSERGARSGLKSLSPKELLDEGQEEPEVSIDGAGGENQRGYQSPGDRSAPFDLDTGCG